MRVISLHPIPTGANITYYAGDGKIKQLPSLEYRDLVVNLELAEHQHPHGPEPTVKITFRRIDLRGERVEAMCIEIICHFCRPVPKSETRIPEPFWNLRPSSQGLPNELY